MSLKTLLLISALAGLIFFAQGLRPEIETEILSLHNSLRSTYGINRMLSWNSNADDYAAKRVKLQVDNCSLSHAGVEGYGENLAFSSGNPEDVQNATFVRHLISLWARQAAPFEENVYNHFTQMVWGGSSLISCATSYGCNDLVFIACLYHEPGNYLGESPKKKDAVQISHDQTNRNLSDVEIQPAPTVSALALADMMSTADKGPSVSSDLSSNINSTLDASNTTINTNATLSSNQTLSADTNPMPAISIDIQGQIEMIKSDSDLLFSIFGRLENFVSDNVGPVFLMKYESTNNSSAFLAVSDAGQLPVNNFLAVMSLFVPIIMMIIA